ncbi:MAG: DNA-directed RNA polymerase subunit omega [Salinibacterium sp.]|nr:DNA-directed RNA polymerase subunit omega [Salinibacterium sp.]
MIEHLKSDEVVKKVGGRFRLCALIQRRLVELMEGARPLIEREGRSDLEVAVEEIVQDKIAVGSLGDVGEQPELAGASSARGALL